jgi:hypothetical protein
VVPRLRLLVPALSLCVLAAQLALPRTVDASVQEWCAVRTVTVEVSIYNTATAATVTSRYRISGTMCWNGTISWPGSSSDPSLTFISGSRAGIENKGVWRSGDQTQTQDWVNLRYTASCPTFPVITFYYLWWYPRINTWQNGYTTYDKGVVDTGGAPCIRMTSRIV